MAALERLLVRVAWISPETIIPGAIAVGVGNVFYRERP